MAGRVPAQAAAPDANVLRGKHIPGRDELRVLKDIGRGSRHLHVRSSRACAAEARALALQESGSPLQPPGLRRPKYLDAYIGHAQATCDASHWPGARVFAALRACLPSRAQPALFCALVLPGSAFCAVAPALAAHETVRRRAHDAWSSRSQELNLLLCEPRPDVRRVIYSGNPLIFHATW